MDQEFYIVDTFKVNFKVYMCSNFDAVFKISLVSSFFHPNSIIMLILCLF